MSELDTREHYDNQMDAEGIVLSKDQIPATSSPVVVDGELERLMKGVDFFTEHGNALHDGFQDCAGIHDPALCNCGLAAAREAVSAYVSQKAEDTRRLDWLDANELSLRHFQTNFSIRAVIDSAMRESPK